MPSSGRIYSFGLGSSGQLGTGDANKKTTPSQVKPTWHHLGNVSAYSIKQITAGGNSNLVSLDQQVSTAIVSVLNVLLVG